MTLMTNRIVLATPEEGKHYIIGKMYMQRVSGDSLCHYGIEIVANATQAYLDTHVVSHLKSSLGGAIVYKIALENSELILYTTDDVEAVFVSFDTLKAMMSMGG